MADKKQGIDQVLIRDLANILNETDLTEIEIEQDDLRIRVSRAGTPQYVSAPVPVAAAPVAVAAAPVAAVRDNKNAVTAPMVGTAYLSPAPGARPFVEVGSNVQEGQTILIIEAMKTMNQIPAPRSGKVTEILVADAAPVEYGEPMIVIE
ncbi:acetyl-CoA carboxylase biotin carboxyl carrier protein [Rhizobium azooxidifex]|jgi:acetyl-CoA carboxylase biotin carboxyl carrier protein|uniref:Biotin carboxyl carrier protein of acetyl-CoA carboxylase n=1 Tax=Mycoplana azooxidifex TaxID=1636188 RepID=A0A7W6D7A9_9HYPH|nr:acetyl-CoA carboxylase biotin carboxyl carrier protein [Mycoplana azooxidifex]MBB3978070.1 acetyl-CoA carboxylase biotin carboxyl carrier protein [Mycoplana azooxidifex]